MYENWNLSDKNSNKFSFQSLVNELLYLHFVYPLTYVGIMASSYMMAAMAHERLTAVCSKNNESWCNLTCYLCIVLIPAVIFNLPKFFEYTLEKDPKEIYAFIPADFKINHNYIRCQKNTSPW